MATLKNHIEAVSGRLFERAKQAFVEEGFVAPVSVAFARRTPHGDVLPPNTCTPVLGLITSESSEEKRESQMRLIEVSDAMALLWLNETFFQVAGEDQRREGLMGYLEHDDGTVRIWTCEVHRAGGKVILTETLEEQPPTPIGILSGYFPRTRARVPQA